MTTDPILSAAITAYLGWPKAHTPTADRRAVLEVAKGAATDAARLVADVEGVIAASDGLPVTDLTDQPDGGAAACKGDSAACARIFHRMPSTLWPRAGSSICGGSSTTDEVLVDVDEWVADTRGVLDRAIRFPLESDLEEISQDAAHDVFQMAATRTSAPLRRR
jgi:hypothetical protein